VSTPPNQDIPAAQRQPSASPAAPAITQKRPSSRGKTFGWLGLIAIAALCAWQWQPISQQATAQTQRLQQAIRQRAQSTKAQSTKAQSAKAQSAKAQKASKPAPTASPQPLPTSTPNLPPLPTISSNPVATSDQPDQLLHHRRYAEASPADLVLLNPTSQLKLQPSVQTAVNGMIAQAKSEGVQLGIASAFRSIEDQNHLFFDVKAERGESSETRAEVSAPPGYSEHHTGYAVDFIDESKPGTHTELSFETTPAYRWLKKNAPAYNFEMSFPKDPNSPVGYEPWHWRYVGDQKSLELFYQEQSSEKPPAPTP